jgi:hypothetical protein
MCALDVVRQWIRPEDRLELAAPAVRWFERSLERGWIRLLDTVHKADFSSMGDRDRVWAIDPARDLRHTAQALKVLSASGSPITGYMSTLRYMLAHQRKDGGWPLRLGGKTQPHAVMSGVELVGTLMSATASHGRGRSATLPRGKLARAKSLGSGYINRTVLAKADRGDLEFPVMCIMRILDDLHVDTAQAVLRALRSAWHADTGQWAATVEAADEIETNALNYAAFCRIADLDDRGDQFCLARIAEFFDRVVGSRVKSSSYVFVLDGYAQLLRRMDVKRQVFALKSVRESDSFRKKRGALYTGFLVKWLISLVNLIDVVERESPHWHTVFHRACGYAATLGDCLTGLPHGKTSVAQLRLLNGVLREGDVASVRREALLAVERLCGFRPRWLEICYPDVAAVLAAFGVTALKYGCG